MSEHIQPSPSDSDASVNLFAPPPLPPRPTPASHRKPAPSVPASLATATDTVATTRYAPPLPPRPPAAPTERPTTYTDNNIYDRSLPPPPPAAPIYNEKGFSATPRRRRFYPSSRRGRCWFWWLLLALIAVIAIVAAVCATVIPRSRKSSTTSSTPDTNTGGGGHPLSAADGGVTLGAAGTIAKFGHNSTDHFVMTTNRSIAVTRLDPIVDPNGPGAHLHRIHGSSYFTANLTNATTQTSIAKCSTAYVQDDKSVYWVPQLFYAYPNGSFEGITLDRTSLYYFMKAPTGTPIVAFPDNYNVVAGSPLRRTVNTSSIAEQALWWQCYRGNGNDLRSNGFPDSACSGGLVQAVQFPSCWDGVYADDADYSTHVAYPTDGSNGYHCPAAFPKKFITVQFETVFQVYNYPFNGAGEINWVLANGDSSGYGIHADFMNGWNPDTLQGVVTDCRYMNSSSVNSGSYLLSSFHSSRLMSLPDPTAPENCAHLNKTIDLDATYSCHLQTPIVDEAVGENYAIPNLPGCNALWSGNVSKPACPEGTVNGGDLDLTTKVVYYQEEPYIA
ncbi:hypothetical protein P7C73_g77, partial [Tremellales sp. Uapishka_1]